MRLENVGKVIAERTIDVDGGSRAIRVLIGSPCPIPGGADCFCPYQIVGLADETVRYTEGVDGAQAIYLAMEAAGTALAASPEGRAGRLSWYGERALGFPVRENRPQLRLVASS